MDRRAPDLEKEAPTWLADDERAALQRLLDDRYRVALRVDGRRGRRGALVVVAIGDDRRAHELVVFARGSTELEAFDRVVDYLGGLLDEMIERGNNPDRGFFLPLDFEGRPFDDGVVFVRGEERDYQAEVEAARMLDEAPPPSLVRRP